jgi:DNA-binding XRE family transcriptional regulator
MSEMHEMTPQHVEPPQPTHDERVQNRVRELRENKLMTQAQLARKAKVALRTIHSVEKGMNCRMDTKRKILLALGLRFEDKDLVFPPTRPSLPFPLHHQ